MVCRKKVNAEKKHCEIVKLEFFFFMCVVFSLVHNVYSVHLCEVYNRAHLINTFVVIALERELMTQSHTQPAS